MIADYFELGDERIYELFQHIQYPWEPLHHLKDYLTRFFQDHRNLIPPDAAQRAFISGDVFIEEGALIEENTYIAGPTVIRRGAQVRFGAYIRGYAYIGEDAIVGHDTEVKHAILLPSAQAAHFAYVGDSILGRHVNLGAGTKLGNVKVDMGKKHVLVRLDGQNVDSGMRKFGAILGDGVSLGCNSVTSPGTLVGRNTLCYPLSSLMGVYPPDSVIKLRQEHKVVPRRI
jgi:NDP-sugar pyrophosphorylase family protein